MRGEQEKIKNLGEKPGIFLASDPMAASALRTTTRMREPCFLECRWTPHGKI